MYLRCFTFDNLKSWFKALAWAEYWYNSAFHTSLGMTPFKALYVRDPPSLVRVKTTVTSSEEAAADISDKDNLLQKLKDNLNRAQQRMKIQADKKRQDLQFEIGEKVLVKLQPYKQHSVALRKNHKLAM